MNGEQLFRVRSCACGNKKLKLIDSYWTCPRIHCDKCGAWAIGNTRQNVVDEWNRCVGLEIVQKNNH